MQENLADGKTSTSGQREQFMAPGPFQIPFPSLPFFSEVTENTQ